MNRQIKRYIGQSLRGSQVQQLAGLRVLSPSGAGGTSFPMWMCLSSLKCSVLPTIGILWRLLHVSMINYITSISSSSALSR